MNEGRESVTRSSPYYLVNYLLVQESLTEKTILETCEVESRDRVNNLPVPKVDSLKHEVLQTFSP
jgi:hypothetical protein